MQRRGFLIGAGGTAAVGAAGIAGWTVRGSGDGRGDEGADESGLGTGHAGSFGIHRTIYSVPMDEKLAALTFDDGPDPEFTPRVLEILDNYGLKATFMMMGYNALHHGDLVAQVVAAGHEIGNHTWTHRDLSTVDAKETAHEIRRGREVIEDVTKLKLRYFRPPRGELNGAAVRVTAETGNDILMWSVTGSVAGREDSAAVARFVNDHLRPGSIVDYHDGIGRGTFSRHEPFAKALALRRRAEIDGLAHVIETALQRGFGFLRVSDLLTHEVIGKPQANVTDESPKAD